MYNNVFPHCHRCGQIPEQGLYDGFRLGKRFFCGQCEAELLSYEVGDFEYLKYAHILREVLFNQRESILNII